jgi:hypothetical protein
LDLRKPPVEALAMVFVTFTSWTSTDELPQLSGLLAIEQNMAEMHQPTLPKPLLYTHHRDEPNKHMS